MTTHCPSQEWDRYCQGDEQPETCVCGKDNMNDDGEWICKEFPGFCCKECADEYEEYYRLAAESEARYYAEMNPLEDAKYWQDMEKLY